MYRVARRAGCQHRDAEDLTQRVMLLVAHAIPDWQKDQARSGFRSWLNRVARNALVSMLRSRHETAVGLAGKTARVVGDVVAGLRILRRSLLPVSCWTPAHGSKPDASAFRLIPEIPIPDVEAALSQDFRLAVGAFAGFVRRAEDVSNLD